MGVISSHLTPLLVHTFALFLLGLDRARGGTGICWQRKLVLTLTALHLELAKRMCSSYGYGCADEARLITMQGAEMEGTVGMCTTILRPRTLAAGTLVYVESCTITSFLPQRCLHFPPGFPPSTANATTGVLTDVGLDDGGGEGDNDDE